MPAPIRSTVRPQRFSRRIGLLLLFGACTVASICLAAPLTFMVDSTLDIPDANPGDGICESTAGNVCTLRAAIQEANAHDGADTIQLQADAIYLLTRVGADDDALYGDLDITDSVAIVGAGPTTLVDGNGGTTGDRVFSLFRCIRGATSMDGSCSNGDVTVTMSDITIVHGRSTGGYGGGIRNDAVLKLDHCIIGVNAVFGSTPLGGGIYNAGTLELDDSLVINNVTSATNFPEGAGIFNQGTLTILRSTIGGNSTAGLGGGILASADVVATVRVRASTISGNSAAQGGGIFETVGLDVVDVINSTISGNFSTGNGGGIYVQSGFMFLYNVTVTENQANSDETGSASGGGVYNAAGTFNFANSIIANNQLIVATVPPSLDFDECAGMLTAQGNNILTSVNTSHCTISGPAMIGGALLGALQDNGGPTFTHALLAGSPAIDAESTVSCTELLDAPLTEDQRGVARPSGAACDIGAFEVEQSIFADGFEPQA